jgi:hypothetical protein
MAEQFDREDNYYLPVAIAIGTLDEIHDHNH